MAAWKGLGYYSRATRLQAGAQAVLSEYPNTVCPIPSTATELQKFPGVGRYTAGAISSIVFGGAEPLLDGNFIRVLSRQLGLHADPKERKVTEALWQVADLLVKRVSNFPMVERSNVPGRWNQAVMELGSTVCTPRPKCGECPIQKTCRAYAEGSLLAEKKKKMKDEDEDEDDMQDVPDIEDACTLCSEIDIEALALRPSFGEANDQEGEKLSEFKEKRIRPKKEKPKPPAKLISAYFAPQTRAYPRYPPFPTSISTSTSTTDAPLSKKRKKRSSDENRTTSDENANENIHITAITAYAALFPIRTHKKKVRESEVVVCVIELQPPPSQPNKPSRYLIEQRPAKGLLASLWQFPQSTITEDSTAATRKSIATKFVTSVKFKKGEQGVGLSTAVYVREVGDLMHVFSHLKLRMWVQLFRVEGSADDEDGLPFSLVMPGDGPRRKWVEGGQMGGETLSTGMRRCWEIVEGVDGGGGQDAEYEDA
jgi:A/G-specific adenine glycosylase